MTATPLREQTSRRRQAQPPRCQPPRCPPQLQYFLQRVSRDSWQQQAFDLLRDQLEALPSDNPISVDSVDRLEFDPPGPTIVLDVTSGYSTPEFISNAAWTVTRSMAAFWAPENMERIPTPCPLSASPSTEPLRLLGGVHAATQRSPGRTGGLESACAQIRLATRRPSERPATS